MKQRHLCTDALVRVQGGHALQQVDLQLVQGRRVLLHRDTVELGEASLEVGQLQGVRPVALVGRAEHLEYFENLIDLTVAREKRSLLRHLSENAASAPQVDAERVMLGREENLGASIPQRDDLVRVSLDGKTKGSGETEVGQLNRGSVVANEQVLRLEIAMEYTVRVEEDEGLANLIKERLGLFGRQGSTLLLHVLLEVVLEVFEHQVELVLGEQHLLKFDNVGMPQILQQADFADSSGRDTIIFLFESDFLNSDQLVRLLVDCLIHDTVGTLTELLETLVLVERADGLGQRPLI